MSKLEAVKIVYKILKAKNSTLLSKRLPLAIEIVKALMEEVSIK